MEPRPGESSLKCQPPGRTPLIRLNEWGLGCEADTVH